MIAVVATTTVTTVAVMTHHPAIQQEEVSVMIVVLAVAHHSLAEVTIFVNLWAHSQVHPEGRTGDASVLVVLEDFGLEIDQ